MYVIKLLITHIISGSCNKRRRTTSKQRLNTAEVDTDSAKSDNGWVNCQKLTKHHLPRYGDPILVAGATFTVSRKYGHKFLFGDELEVGKIHSVVRRHGSSTPFFKFYNLLEYPEHPPPLGSSSFMYHQCDQMMSTNEKKTGIKWTAKSSGTNVTKKRARKTLFEKEYALPTRGMYDKEDELDLLRQKSQKKRQESDSDESSNSSDDDVPTYKSRNSICRQVSDDTSSSSEVGDDEEGDSEREFTSTKVTAVDLSKANYWVDEEW